MRHHDPAEPATEPASILIVAGSQADQRVLSEVLSQDGCTVRIAGNCTQALAQISRQPPDLILLDMLPPEIEGLSLCRQLHEQQASRGIPIIFISAANHSADLLSGFAAGGADYITKPFQLAEILARVRVHLKILRLQRQLAVKNRQFELVQQQAESLLRNTLPEYAAAELMAKGSCSPRCFANAAVCFVDIVQFTAAAATLTPDALIGELNDLFAAFDLIAEVNHCKRIKTIGDAYLFVSGIPESSDSHVRDAATAAVEMMAYVKDRNRTGRHWQVRIGLHAGPLVGGIVGTKRYRYDIFGDAVNVAARLQAMSEPMRINVSAEVYNQLRDEFVFSGTQPVEMKGKGMQSTYFLERQQQAPSSAPV